MNTDRTHLPDYRRPEPKERRKYAMAALAGAVAGGLAIVAAAWILHMGGPAGPLAALFAPLYFLFKALPMTDRAANLLFCVGGPLLYAAYAMLFRVPRTMPYMLVAVGLFHYGCYLLAVLQKRGAI